MKGRSGASDEIRAFRILEKMVEGMSPQDQSMAAQAAMEILEGNRTWLPHPGAQSDAYWSQADELFYGGQGGGGKTDLLIGTALTQQRYSLILRRKNKEVRGLEHRMTEILGAKEGGHAGEWKFADGRFIQLGGCQYEENKFDYQGVPHDLKGFDEITNFSRTQYKFIIGWNRSSVPGQRCRVICTGNPPMTPEGDWVREYWAPWLDPTHPNPAEFGELRWFTTIDGEDTEVDGPEPVHDGRRWVKPRSRTFIPGTLEDNPVLEDSGYGAVLGALPSGMREAVAEGNFQAGMIDDEMQLIPTAWVQAAMDRWEPDQERGFQMTALGVDPNGAGVDKPNGRDPTVLAPRYGTWYAPLVVKTSQELADHREVLAFIVSHLADGAGVVIDIGGGYGIAPAGLLETSGVGVTRFDGSKDSTARAEGSGLQFYNLRSEAWWRFREALDPSQPGGSIVALPRDPKLKADLTAPRWGPDDGVIKVESKKDIKKRLHRSTDRGDAVVMAWSEGTKLAVRRHHHTGRRPQVNRGRLGGQKRR